MLAVQDGTTDKTELAVGGRHHHHMFTWQRVIFRGKSESLNLTFMKDHLYYQNTHIMYRSKSYIKVQCTEVKEQAY